jgi:hypothetical protein
LVCLRKLVSDWPRVRCLVGVSLRPQRRLISRAHHLRRERISLVLQAAKSCRPRHLPRRHRHLQHRLWLASRPRSVRVWIALAKSSAVVS